MARRQALKRERPRSCDRGLPTDGAVPGIRPNRISRSRLHVVGALAVIAEVEAFALLLHGRTQADGEVHHLVDDERADTGPDERRGYGFALGDDLRPEVVV